MDEQLISNLSYTNKDFQTIYPELLDTVKRISNRWDPSQSNESDPGVVLLKLVSIIADKLNYNIDKNILECFPASVTQEANARELFEQLGYHMKWHQAATGKIQMAWKSSENLYSYNLPEFTMVSNDDDTIVYTLTSPVTLNGDGSVVTCNAIQGVIQSFKINGESLITVRNLDSNNRLYFANNSVAENGIFISNSRFGYSAWEKVDNLELQEYGKPCYKFGVTQVDNICYIEFPKDVEDLFEDGIEIFYISTDGSAGNISAKTISKFFNSPSATYFDENNVEQSIILSESNTNVTNFESIRNGYDKETIDEAYSNYKKTVGTFNTLVTLRDYNNAIKSLDINSQKLISNGFVCDRTNDLQSSYKVIVDTDGVEKLDTFVSKTADKADIDAFDLKIYAFENISASDDVITSGKILSKGAKYYNKTFDLLNNTDYSEDYKIELVKEYLKETKSLQHDFIHILSDKICLIKNKYPINCKIIPQYNLTESQVIDVKNNVLKNIYNKFSSKHVDFSKEIDYNELYNVIIKSDNRIQNIILDNLEYETYAVYYSSNDGEYKEVKISDIDISKFIKAYKQNDKFYKDVECTSELSDLDISNSIIVDAFTGECYKKSENIYRDYLSEFQIEIYAKSVLSGNTSLFKSDNTFKHRLSEKFVDQIDDIKNISTNSIIEVSSDDNSPVASYTLRDNESIHFYAPNLEDKTTYSSYVKFQHSLKSDVDQNSVYKLKQNESITFYWKESDDDNANYNFVKYGEGAIISPNFTIQHQYSYDTDPTGYVGNSYIAYYNDTHGCLYAEGKCNYTESQVLSKLISDDYILSTTKEIVIKGKIEVKIQYPYLCYWILNDKVSDPLTGLDVYRLFDSKTTKTGPVKDQEYILQPGEYFIYSNPQKTALEMVAAGTKITRSTSGNYLREMACDVADSDTIMENGLSAVDSYFKSINKSETITLTEMQIMEIPPNATITLQTNRWVTDTTVSGSVGQELRGTQLIGEGKGPSNSLSTSKDMSSNLDPNNGQFAYNKSFSKNWQWVGDTLINSDDETEETYIDDVSSYIGLNYCEYIDKDKDINTDSINLEDVKSSNLRMQDESDNIVSSYIQGEDLENPDNLVGKNPADFGYIAANNFTKIVSYEAPEFDKNTFYSKDSSGNYILLNYEPLDWKDTYINYYWKKPYHAHNPKYYKDIVWTEDAYENRADNASKYTVDWVPDKLEKDNTKDEYLALGKQISEINIFPDVARLNGVPDDKDLPKSTEEIKKASDIFVCAAKNIYDFDKDDKRKGKKSLYKYIATYENEDDDYTKFTWYKNFTHISFIKDSLPINTYHAYNPKYKFNGNIWVADNVAETDLDTSGYIRIGGTGGTPYGCTLVPYREGLKCYNEDTKQSFITRTFLETVEETSSNDSETDSNSDSRAITNIAGLKVDLDTPISCNNKQRKWVKISASSYVAHPDKDKITVYVVNNAVYNFYNKIIKFNSGNGSNNFIPSMELTNSINFSIIKDCPSTYIVKSGNYEIGSFSKYYDYTINDFLKKIASSTKNTVSKVVCLYVITHDTGNTFKLSSNNTTYVSLVDCDSTGNNIPSPSDNPSPTSGDTNTTTVKEKEVTKWVKASEDYSNDSNAIIIIGKNSPENSQQIILKAKSNLHAMNQEFGSTSNSSSTRYFTVIEDYETKSWTQVVKFNSNPKDTEFVKLLNVKDANNLKSSSPIIEKIIPKVGDHIYSSFKDKVWLEDYAPVNVKGERTISGIGVVPENSFATTYVHCSNPSFDYKLVWQLDDECYAGTDAIDFVANSTDTPDDIGISPKSLGQHVVNTQYKIGSGWELVASDELPTEYKKMTSQALKKAAESATTKFYVYSTASPDDEPPIPANSKEYEKVEFCVNIGLKTTVTETDGDKTEKESTNEITWWKKTYNFGRSWTAVKEDIPKSWTAFEVTVLRSWTGEYRYSGKSWHSEDVSNLRAWRTEPAPIKVRFTNDGYKIIEPSTATNLGVFTITSKLSDSSKEEKLPTILIDNGWEAKSSLNFEVSNDIPIILKDGQEIAWYNKDYSSLDKDPNSYGIIKPNYYWQSEIFPNSYNLIEHMDGENIYIDSDYSTFRNVITNNADSIHILASSGLRICDDYRSWTAVEQKIWVKDTAYNDGTDDRDNISINLKDNQIDNNTPTISPYDYSLCHINTVANPTTSWTSISTNFWIWREDLEYNNIGAKYLTNINYNADNHNMYAKIIPDAYIDVYTFDTIKDSNIYDIAINFEPSNKYVRRSKSGTLEDPFEYSVEMSYDTKPDDWVDDIENNYFTIRHNKVFSDYYNAQHIFKGVYKKLLNDNLVKYQSLDVEPDGWPYHSRISTGTEFRYDPDKNIVYYKRTGDGTESSPYEYTELTEEPEGWNSDNPPYYQKETYYTSVVYSTYGKDLYVYSDFGYSLDGGVFLDVTRQSIDSNIKYMSLYACEQCDYSDSSIDILDDQVRINIDHSIYRKLDFEDDHEFIPNKFYYKDIDDSFILLKNKPDNWNFRYIDYYVRDNTGESYTEKCIKFKLPSGRYIVPFTNNIPKLKELSIKCNDNFDNSYDIKEFGYRNGSDIIYDFSKKRKYYLDIDTTKLHPSKTLYWDFNASNGHLPKIAYIKNNRYYSDNSCSVEIGSQVYVMSKNDNLIYIQSNDTPRFNISFKDFYLNWSRKFTAYSNNRIYIDSFDNNLVCKLGHYDSRGNFVDENGAYLSYNKIAILDNGLNKSLGNSVLESISVNNLLNLLSNSIDEELSLILNIKYPESNIKGYLLFDSAFKYMAPDYDAMLVDDERYSLSNKEMFFDIVLNRVSILDYKQMFNYVHNVDSGIEIKNPLKPYSFFNTNHPYNKYVICQADIDKLNISVFNNR